jgi:hypothetical protein
MFYNYQIDTLDKMKVTGLLVTSHCHEMLALSSVLLLKPDQHPADLLRFFSLDHLGDMYLHTQKIIFGPDQDPVFDFDLLYKIRVIVEVK